MVEDPSSLLVSPARISHSVAEEGGDVLRDDRVLRFYDDAVRPVKVVVVSDATDRHGNDFNQVLHPISGQVQRVVTAYGGYGYGKLPFWLSCIQNGHHDLSTSMVDARRRERLQMQDLNEKLAEYIEKVRYLEAENKQLSKELNNLKERWGRERATVRAMYQVELSDNRKLLDDLDKDKTSLEIKITSLGEQLREANKKIEDLEVILCEERDLTKSFMNKMADLESNCGYLGRKLSDMEADKKRDLSRISNLTQQLEKTKSDLDNETLLFIDSENRRQTLEEQMNFMNIIHDQEMKELAGLVCRDSTAENREFWKGEMEKAIKEIMELFDEQINNYKDDIVASYDWRIQEYISGINKDNLEISQSKDEGQQMKKYLNELHSRLMDAEEKNQVLVKEIEFLRRQRDGLSLDEEDHISKVICENIGLRSELKSVLAELHSSTDGRLALEKELMDYKKIVNQTTGGSKEVFKQEMSISSEERKVKNPKNIQVTDVTSSETVSMDSQSTVKGEMSSKVRVQKVSKGNISITECAEDGSYVAIENFGVQAEHLNGWYLERSVDDTALVRYFFEQVTISPGTKIKVWSESKFPSSSSALEGNDLIFHSGCWKNGIETTRTTLYNCHNEEKSSFVQKTKFA